MVASKEYVMRFPRLLDRLLIPERAASRVSFGTLLLATPLGTAENMQQSKVFHSPQGSEAKH